jgi:hypothetical protein
VRAFENLLVYFSDNFDKLEKWLEPLAIQHVTEAYEWKQGFKYGIW